MVTNENKIKKMCSFYVSDFHLEMIMLPYITDKIKQNKRIVIITENDLENSINILLSKMNIKNKKEILELGWKNNNIENIGDNCIIIINGSEQYIKTINEQIEERNIQNSEIIDCYKFEEIKEEMEDIVRKHERVINNIYKW